MMNQICEWNDFVIFHENITFGASWHMNGCPFRFAFKSAFYSPKRLNKMKRCSSYTIFISLFLAEVINILHRI